MPFLSKVFKSKDANGVGKGRMSDADAAAANANSPPKPKWDDAWTRHWVLATEVDELLHVCTQEMKSRALDMPFLLLPFRPSSDPSAARTFIRNYFKTSYGPSEVLTGDKLQHELKLIEPLVLCSIMKWCWSRLNGGVVTWSTYELFKTGEKQSKMAKHAFDTFIPLSVENSSRKRIVFDFFDLLAAIAANGKTNGLGGRKLSRLAGWWAFELSDDGKGFDGGYRAWEQAADAASHMFFAYLRSLAPDGSAGSSGISKLPRSLQALVSQTEYPPEITSLPHTITPKVVMMVENVSPTPYALLRRAKNFEYRADDAILQKFSHYDDPIHALTFECRRVLDAISSANSSSSAAAAITTEATVASPTDASWSRFEDLGFSSLLDDPSRSSEANKPSSPRFSNSDLKSIGDNNTTDLGRPQTPSWADFLSEGFSDDAAKRGPASLLLPPDQMLPPISPARVQSSQSLRSGVSRDDNLEPGELASISKMELDETFWWVWMTSLAGEEPSQRKAVFGRIAFIETEIAGGKWLVVEEQVKGPEVIAPEDSYLAEKKSRSLFGKRSRTRRASNSTRKNSTKPAQPYANTSSTQSRVNVGADQQAKVEAAAAALIKEQSAREAEKIEGRRRARSDENIESKTNSVLTLQPVIMKEAGPAMQWARKFDKETIRDKYLGDELAGKGIARSLSPSDYGRSPLDYKPPPSPKAYPEESLSAEKSLPAEPSTLDARAAPPLPPPPKPLNDNERAMISPVTPTSPEAVALPPMETANGNAQKTLTSKKSNVQTPPRAVPPKDVEQPVRTVPANAAAAAAAAAASKAMQNASSSPTSPTSVKSKKGSTRVMDKLFGRKGKSDEQEPEAIARHRQILQGSTATQERAAAPRRGSLLRKAVPGKATADVPNVPVAAAAVPAPAAEPQPVPTLEDLEQGEPGPDQVEDATSNGVLAPSAPLDESVNHAASHVQHPQDKQADFAPNEPTLEHTEPVHEIAPEAPPKESFASDDMYDANEAVVPSSANSEGWSQIRKDVPEGQEHASRLSQSGRTEKTDDGETSGEETIEARIARVRARVAELTSGASTAPPPTKS